MEKAEVVTCTECFVLLLHEADALVEVHDALVLPGIAAVAIEEEIFVFNIIMRDLDVGNIEFIHASTGL